MNSKKVEFKNDKGQTLAARLELPEGEPLAYGIFAHCFTCSKDIAAASRISRGLAAKGVGVLRFDFTGLGNSEGDFANTNFSSNVQDLLSAVDFLRQNYQAPKILIGHSLGGAAVLATAPKVDEAVAVATIAAPSDAGHVSHLFEGSLEKIEADGEAEVDLAGRKFKVQKQFLDDIKEQDILSGLKHMKKALLVLHSAVDNLVGVDHARKIFMAAQHPKSFVSLDPADHLLSKPKDSQWVAGLIAEWANRFLDLDALNEKAKTARPSEGTVRIQEKDHKFLNDIFVGAHSMIADEPLSVGGTNLGPTPYDYLLSGLGACTSMTIRMYATHKKIALDHVQVDLKHSKIHAKDCEECETKVGKIDQIEREITLIGNLSPEERARLLEIADKCPVHRTLHSEVNVKSKLADI